MKIKIQGYWNAEVKSSSAGIETPEQRIAAGNVIIVCDVIINDKCVGSVCWNGKNLFIEAKKFEPKKPVMGERYEDYFKYLGEYIINYFKELSRDVQKR